MPKPGDLLRPLLLTLLAILVVGCGEEEAPRPERVGDDQELERVNYDAREGSTTRTREELEAQEQPDKRPDPTPAETLTRKDERPETPAAEADRPVVIVRAIDTRTKQRVFEFLGTPVDTSVDVEPFRQAENGELRYEKPKTGDFELQLEAEGYVSPEPVKLQFDETNPLKILNVEMLSASTTSGIQLRASRTDTTPVTNLQIRVESRPLGAALNAPFRLVWERISVHPEGIHNLPDLKAGRYRTRVFPVNEQKQPELFVPQDLEFDFDEIRALEQVVIFQPGGQIALQIEDPTTGLPVEGRSTQVLLLDALGQKVDRNWEPLNREDRSAGFETLPTTGRHDLNRPIAPGLYTLRVLRGGIDTEPIEQAVSVVGGLVREVTIR